MAVQMPGGSLTVGIDADHECVVGADAVGEVLCDECAEGGATCICTGDWDANEHPTAPSQPQLVPYTPPLWATGAAPAPANIVPLAHLPTPIQQVRGC